MAIKLQHIEVDIVVRVIGNTNTIENTPILEINEPKIGVIEERKINNLSIGQAIKKLAELVN